VPSLRKFGGIVSSPREGRPYEQSGEEGPVGPPLRVPRDYSGAIPISFGEWGSGGFTLGMGRGGNFCEEVDPTDSLV